MHHAHDEELKALFSWLRAEGVQCRSYEDETGIELLWKPKPVKMEPAMREAVRNHAAALACILVPNKPGPSRSLRPFWSAGTGLCIGCGHLCMPVDPLGQSRHDWCGWLDQKQTEQQVSHQKRLWHGQSQGKSAPARLHGA